MFSVVEGYLLLVHHAGVEIYATEVISASVLLERQIGVGA